MPELLAAPNYAPAPPQPAWLPTREQLLLRPLEYGIAIDPLHAHEIDDAVYAEALDEDNKLYTYKVHIADGGLLAGTPHLETARERGWTHYYRKHADTMLPDEVVSQLSLDRESGEDGQPALTVSFIAGEGVPPTDFQVYKSRLICQSLSYAAYARRVRQHYHPGNPLSFDDEAAVFEASRFLSKSRRGPVIYNAVRNTDEHESVPFLASDASSMTSYYMLFANIGMARMSQADGLPYIFRNHHFQEFDHPLGSTIHALYPNSEVFTQNHVAWYSRIPTQHEGIREPVFGHATSPLRRSPDLYNHVNRSAVLNGEEPPFDEAYMDEFVRELADKIRRHMGIGSVAVAGSALAA